MNSAWSIGHWFKLRILLFSDLSRSPKMLFVNRIHEVVLHFQQSNLRLFSELKSARCSHRLAFDACQYFQMSYCHTIQKRYQDCQFYRLIIPLASGCRHVVPQTPTSLYEDFPRQILGAIQGVLSGWSVQKGPRHVAVGEIATMGSRSVFITR